MNRCLNHPKGKGKAPWIRIGSPDGSMMSRSQLSFAPDVILESGVLCHLRRQRPKRAPVGRKLERT